MEKLSKRALGCMYVATALSSFLGIAAIIVANVLWLGPKGIEIGKVISIVLIVLLLIHTAISPYFRFHRYQYAITEEFIDVREGYIFVERHLVPLERLHKMQTNKGPIDRMFKVAKVTVTTAGGDVTLRFLDEEKADYIAESLSKRINQIVVEQRDEDGK